MPVTMHQRAAWDFVFDLIKQSPSSHCDGSDMPYVEQANNLQMYLELMGATSSMHTLLVLR